MNTQLMVDSLGFRLEDVAARKFPVNMRLDVLNTAQLMAVNMLDNNLLTELQEVETGLTFAVATGGIDAYYALTGLANEIARNGVINAKINGASGKYYNIIPHKEIKDTENVSYLDGTDDYPIGYVFKNRFYSRTTSVVTLDLWYLKKPSTLQYTYTTDSVSSAVSSADIAGREIVIIESELTSTADDFYNGAVIYNKTEGYYAIVTDYDGGTTALTILHALSDAIWETSDEWYFVKGPGSNEKLGDFESELNDNLHEIIVDLAESTLYKMVADISRSDKALEKALAQINALNARAQAEAAAGIGTKASGS